MVDTPTRPLSEAEVQSLRGALAFTVLAHVVDLITTQFRDPLLHGEGNPFYLLAQHLGYGGWAWLVITKVLGVWAMGAAFWWYLSIRHNFLPPKIVHNPRSLIWYGMWDRRPYPRSLLARLFNARKFKFLALVLAGIALPGSGATALVISLDNVMFRLGHAIPVPLANEMLLFTMLAVFIWWYWAFWAYYQSQVRAGTIADEP